MKVFVPPLKCQGIKTKLVPWILDTAGRDFSRWVEPFMGSGVVGFNAAPQRALFGDSNPHIIAFYSAIQSGRVTEHTVRRYLQREGALLRTADDNGYAHYRLVRDRFNGAHDPHDFLFLSRAGFNGMMRFSKTGNWNIPFCKKPDRFAPAYITKICNQVANCSLAIQDTWVFRHQDFRKTILSAGADDMIYCDPPYLGRYTDYYNNWTEEDERELSGLLKTTKARFVLSSWHHNDYRVNVNLEKYWSGFNIVTRDHFYHSGAREENRNSMVEALICNFDIAHIAEHNHGVYVKPQQQFLFDENGYEDQPSVASCAPRIAQG